MQVNGSSDAAATRSALKRSPRMASAVANSCSAPGHLLTGAGAQSHKVGDADGHRVCDEVLPRQKRLAPFWLARPGPAAAIICMHRRFMSPVATL